MDTILEQTRIPENEKERLANLYSYNIIENHDKTGTFQHIVSMAARIFNVPIALVSFVDEMNVVAQANIEMEGAGEFSRDISLCSMAILKNEVTVFENAREEPCLLTNLMVYGNFGLQFYAGAPLKTPGGFNIGVLAIVDKKPRTFSKDEEALLEGLAAIVMEELEERLSVSS
ncbi:GAF domain-containing protein [Pontibacter diazotrophicus]|uniref:GAF domain-containing protein n=1 Tax=Pontibacter diazotrophicus TaxID=1400979 RepID=A0A3D8LC65_9BACT|nr:GAF domain-containing protein [Pontibacter diazotrophicus]RDV15008.1 GAF domain-containing protein [Pontibacter diazotrophicus]